ncbi:MAG: hypothetical protein DRI32_01820 [Chloroflexi bacterium]|nr:MAG: hypothetical protein B5M51_04355 [Anaerolinea sp. 4484_236]RLD06921.1 MAG: hypothetical protein DRI32_01820 [Chloroflexota bacterium]
MPTVIRKVEVKNKADLHPTRQSIGWQMQVNSKVWSPPTDVYESENAYTVRIEIAGMREADFTVSVEGSYLIVNGSRPDVKERHAYRQMEIRCGKFTCAVSLPDLIDLENANAEYEDGFFVIVLPKIKSQKIAIQEK